VLLGLGDAIRELPGEFKDEAPPGISSIRVFCPGCLVVSGTAHAHEAGLAQRLAENPSFEAWPLIVLTDDADFAVESEQNFLWSTFTRFEPAQDIVAKTSESRRYHHELSPPIVIDSRMKSSYPTTVEPDPQTVALVDRRWSEYFPK
jgi:3-polyprenyl-4-hydroxybenzoate decarboxylase